MAAPILRRYGSSPGTTALATLVTVPANRALVISKITASHYGATACTLQIVIGGQNIAINVPITPGQVYTETGLVALAGETVQVANSVASQVAFSLFAEEVDN